MAPQQSALLDCGEAQPAVANGTHGAALALVLLVLILIGGFVAGAFVPALEEIRAGRNTLRLVQAAAAAQGGVDETIAYWPGAGYDTLRPGDSSLVGAAALVSRSGWYNGAVYRWGPDIFLVRVRGFSRDSASRHAIGIILQRTPFETGIWTALAAEGPVVAGPAMVIREADSPPESWTDCPASEPVTPSSGEARESPDGAVADSMMRRVFQRVDAHAASAVHLTPGHYEGIGPVQSGDRCLRTDPRNWGDPGRPGGPCAGYFPVIDVAGDLGVNGGVGQGVLIVHGGLTLDGGFEFYGPVFVDGPVAVRRATLFGGVLAAGGGAEVRLERGAVIYSKCVLTRASLPLGEIGPLSQRQWIELP